MANHIIVFHGSVSTMIIIGQPRPYDKDNAIDEPVRPYDKDYGQCNYHINRVWYLSVHITMIMNGQHMKDVVRSLRQRLMAHPTSGRWRHELKYREYRAK